VRGKAILPYLRAPGSFKRWLGGALCYCFDGGAIRMRPWRP